MKSDLNEVLFLAASSGDGQFRYLVDPELKRRLLAAGIRCSSCFINQLTREHLEEADTAVMTILYCRKKRPGCIITSNAAAIWC